ncbi:MAG TPA: thymidylate synthase [Nevskiaceae bacterium]|nr:thymidylate synthase [Nevskiaceae bacterium]
MVSLKERLIFTNKENLRPGEIPSISVYGENLPEAWENAVLATWEFGTLIPTEYDQPEDPESRDATMMITVASPLTEPRIHKDFPDGLEGLAIYTQEVVAGVHDARVKEGGWSYSYHDRLFNWPGVDGWKNIKALVGKEIELPRVDQIEALSKKLAQAPHSRRAQAITWNPLNDAIHHEPPCLQRIWCRVVKSEEDLYLLEMNTNWRSRDALKAAFMNMFAVTELQKQMAQQISEISGRRVEAGRYVDISDSFHIYGSDVRKGEMERFLQRIGKLEFERRTYRSDDPVVLQEFGFAAEKLAKE